MRAVLRVLGAACCHSSKSNFPFLSPSARSKMPAICFSFKKSNPSDRNAAVSSSSSIVPSPSLSARVNKTFKTWFPNSVCAVSVNRPITSECIPIILALSLLSFASPTISFVNSTAGAKIPSASFFTGFFLGAGGAAARCCALSATVASSAGDSEADGDVVSKIAVLCLGASRAGENASFAANRRERMKARATSLFILNCSFFAFHCR
mmetsp:Transcript_11392/g.32814  ORF Transcript_11392/g.32814 Transcript_11392/m.32814 type:complete len:208 (+) Transcript_11392:227-850(+)